MVNKGFTLIEIIVVIAILGVLSTIVTIGLTSTLDNTNKDDCNNFVKEIEEAACVYVSMSNKKIVCNREVCEDIPLSILVSEGLIKRDTDGCTKKELDLNSTVSVTWSSEGEKTCTYNGVREYEK